MLKSTFKKVSAIAIAGTMLAGMMAVPANAMTEQTVSKDVVIPVISENFDNAAVKDYALSSSDFQTIDEITNVSFKKNQSWSGSNTFSVIADDSGESGNVTKFTTSEGIDLRISKGGAPVALQPGDKVKISFRFKSPTTNNGDVLLILNDNTSTRLEHLSSTNGWTKDYSSTTSGHIMQIRSDGRFVTNTDPWGDPSFTKDEWNTMNIVIDTQDSTQGGVQTIRATNTAPDGTTEQYFYDRYDAVYIGDDDTDYTKLDNIYQLKFYTEYNSKGFDFYIDDVSVTVEGTRSNTEYVSDLSNTVLEENFTNFTGINSSNQLQGTSFVLARPWGSGDFTVTNVGGAAKTSVTKSTLATLTADFDDVVLGEDEAIRFSFDTTKNAGVWASIGSTSMASPKIRLTSLDENPRTSDLTGDTTNVQMHFINGGRIHPGRLQTGADAMMLEGYTYHFEYTIVPSDPAHGNKQTLTVNVTGPEDSLTNFWNTNNKFSQYKETFYMDADRSTDGEQKFDSLSKFFFGNYFTSADGTIDNVKVEVIKPGFEVVDVNNSTNTYTFSGTAPIKLNYVTNASAASKVIVAQYDNTKRLIKAEPADVAASGRGTVTVTPVEGAQTIKLMVLDMSTAAPYAQVFKLTKSN